jgi:hypothetical protein
MVNGFWSESFYKQSMQPTLTREQKRQWKGVECTNDKRYTTFEDLT